MTVVALRDRRLPEREEQEGFVVDRAVEAGALAGPTIRSAASERGTALRLPRLSAAVWLRDKLVTARMTRAALAHPADVYHAHDLNTLAAGAEAAGKRLVSLVYDAHELYPDLTGFKPSERARWRRLERRLIGSADAVICPSHAIGHEIAGRYGVRHPFVVMNCPPAQQLPPHQTGSPLDRLRRPGTALIVYAGGYTVNRGLENLVRAMDLIESAHLVMLGWGPLESALRSLAGERVTFLDPVQPDEVVAAIASADVGVVPMLPLGRNHELAAPNKLFEYVQAGLAVAGSDLPEMRRMIQEHRLGSLFDARDPSSIAQTVMSMLPHLDAFRANARNAAAIYTWEAQESVLLGVYDSLRA